MRMLLGALALPLVLAACPSSRVNIEEATKVLRSSDGCPRLNVGGHKAPSLDEVRALGQALAANSDVRELVVGNDREHAKEFGVHTATKLAPKERATRCSTCRMQMTHVRESDAAAGVPFFGGWPHLRASPRAEGVRRPEQVARPVAHERGEPNATPSAPRHRARATRSAVIL